MEASHAPDAVPDRRDLTEKSAGQDSIDGEQQQQQRQQQSQPSGISATSSIRPHDPQKQEQASSPPQSSSNKKSDDDQQGTDGGDDKPSGPAGGYSDTPIPRPAAGVVGYTLKITMHRAVNLAMGDMETFSSDPYVLAQMNSATEMRHKEDPYLRFRTYTIRRKTDPEWEENWIVANVPSSGFKLKLRVYDEDPADHDDLLGKASITVDSIGDDWTGIRNQGFRLNLAKSSKRALLVRSIAACFRGVPGSLQGELFVSIENLGRTGDDGQSGRLYTVGECRWFRHYSPMLGRLTNIKNPIQKRSSGHAGEEADSKTVERYNFQANQIQLQGPVPAQLYHRFVEFQPWVKRMFTTSGLQGIVLGKALHHQHQRVYNFGRSTAVGHFPEGPCEALTKKFLDLVNYDRGGRIFTYVLTLDALWRFTETGKEFGVDMLSKHTMHSDVSIYIAFSGEFFIRRMKHSHRPAAHGSAGNTAHQGESELDGEQTHPPDDIDGGPPNDNPPTDPSYYELVIDNDSGTYRPNAKMLPQLADFLTRSLPGLNVKTLDSQGDAEKMARMKSEQRERKKHEGDHIIYTQHSRGSSISSSDASDLDRVQGDFDDDQGRQEHHHHQQQQQQQQPPPPPPGAAERADVRSGDGGAREHGTTRAVARDLKHSQAAKLDRFTRFGRRGDGDSEEAEDGREGV